MRISIANLTSVLALAFGTCSIVNAQQLNEQELKINVDKISNSTERIKALEPITFVYNTDKYKKLNLPAGNQYGFLASNVEGVFPDLVQESSQFYSTGKNTSKVARYEEVNSNDLIPLLVAALKEQQAQIEALQQEVNTLKSK
ncbi:tail fiber domain-containing protein [Sphingobacterium olei]|uniref:Tail fiber domain-containing protein n=1 Tax=Sphingobacterium olei TaxID=2571155 RepID=A0A4U0NHE8_9SPHI|nr:tail fiber domain-containing protein [Sphingobacterium olei]TJZ53641.1 tail fiber domain-containing protein [Sphingobacterium olei]